MFRPSNQFRPTTWSFAQTIAKGRGSPPYYLNIFFRKLQAERGESHPLPPSNPPMSCSFDMKFESLCYFFWLNNFKLIVTFLCLLRKFLTFKIRNCGNWTLLQDYFLKINFISDFYEHVTDKENSMLAVSGPGVC